MLDGISQSLVNMASKVGKGDLDKGVVFDLVESFVNTLEIWRKAIASYRPVAKSAAEGADEAPQFGATGFVQV